MFCWIVIAGLALYRNNTLILHIAAVYRHALKAAGDGRFGPAQPAAELEYRLRFPGILNKNRGLARRLQVVIE